MQQYSRKYDYQKSKNCAAGRKRTELKVEEKFVDNKYTSVYMMGDSWVIRKAVSDSNHSISDVQLRFLWIYNHLLDFCIVMLPLAV